MRDTVLLGPFSVIAFNWLYAHAVLQLPAGPVARLVAGIAVLTAAARRDAVFIVWSTPLVTGSSTACMRRAHDPRPPAGFYRHQGGGARAARSTRRGWKPISAASDGLRRPAHASSSSRAGSRTRPICWRRRRGAYVLRRKPPGKLLPSAHAVDREFRVISALHAQGFPVAEPLALLRRRRRRRHRVLRDGLRRRPRVLGAADAGLQSGRARRGLRRDERHHRAPAQLRSGEDRLGRFRPRRELRRAPGRALVEAVPRLGDRKDRRHGAADRMAARRTFRRPVRRGWCTATTGSTI